jgi:hypothetical protein
VFCAHPSKKIKEKKQQENKTKSDIKKLETEAGRKWRRKSRS